MENNTNPSNQNNVVINNVVKKGNGPGTAGFVLALLGILLCWVPVLDWILWLLGLIFSAVGVFKKPKGLAIAGLVLSLLGVILIIALAATIASIF